MLSNLYLHELDKYIESLIKEFTTGKKRPPNPFYKKYEYQKRIIRRKIDQEGKKPELIAKLKETDKKMKQLPSKDTYSSSLTYVSIVEGKSYQLLYTMWESWKTWRKNLTWNIGKR